MNEFLQKHALTWLPQGLINFGTYMTILLPLIIAKYWLRTKKYPPDDETFFGKSLNFLFFGKSGGLESSVEPVTQSVKTHVLYRGSWLAFCIAGLWGTLISAGYLQEKIFKTPYGCNTTESNNQTQLDYYTDSQFIVFFNRLFSTVLAGFILLFQGDLKSRTGFVEYGFCSLTNVLSAWYQYEALKLVNFTTVVLFKGSRILPVMLMNWLLAKTKHSIFDWGTAVLLCIGSVMFMLAKDVGVDGASMSTTSSGIVCLVLYVAFDAFTSNWQQRLYTKKMSVIEMAFGVCFFSTLFTFASLMEQSSLTATWEFGLRHEQFWKDVLILAMASAFSQIFIALTIKKFGAVVFIIIMTTRSIPQVIVSWLFFKHTFGTIGWLGVLITFLTIFLKVAKTVRNNFKKHKERTSVEKNKETRKGLSPDNRLESAVTIEETLTDSDRNTGKYFENFQK